MARTISDEELQLKRRARRRLIGAIVLVTAIVVVLPMVLDSEPRQASQEVSVQIPSPDSGVFASKVVPEPGASDAKAAQKAPPDKPEVRPVPVEEPKPVAVAPEPPAPAKEAPKEAPKVAPKETPKPAPKPEAKTEPSRPAAAVPAAEPAKPAAKKAKPAPKPASGQFVVQVIALADAEKAKQIQGQIAAAGIKSYTEVVKTSKGNVTRVRAGPFGSRGAAEKARDQLKALGMNGNITTR